MKKISITLCLMLMLTACTNGTTAIDVASSLSTENIITEISAEEKIEYPAIIKTTAKNIELTYHSEGIFCIFTGEKFGFIKENGIEITSYVYDFAQPFNEGLAYVMKNDKYGFIDKEENEIIPLVYDKVSSFSEGLAYFEIGNNYGFINKNGEEMFLLDCDSVSSFKKGNAYFSIDGKYGFIDTNGKKVIDNIYDDANFFNNGFAVVRNGANIGAIDKKGNEIIPTEYNWINIEKDYFVTYKDDMITYFDFSGKKINSNENILSIIVTYDNYTIFTNNTHYGVLDSNKNTILSPIYNYISFIEGSNLFIVNLNGKYGIINDKGELKVPLQYDNIHIPYESKETAYVIVRIVFYTASKTTKSKE